MVALQEDGRQQSAPPHRACSKLITHCCSPCADSCAADTAPLPTSGRYSRTRGFCFLRPTTQRRASTCGCHERLAGRMAEDKRHARAGFAFFYPLLDPGLCDGVASKTKRFQSFDSMLSKAQCSLDRRCSSWGALIRWSQKRNEIDFSLRHFSHNRAISSESLHLLPRCSPQTDPHRFPALQCAVKSRISLLFLPASAVSCAVVPSLNCSAFSAQKPAAHPSVPFEGALEALCVA